MLTGRQKAAMLLMSLDTPTAAELLKGLEPEEIQEIAIELARIDAAEQHDTREQARVIQEFCKSLQDSQTQAFNIKTFLGEMLVSILGKEQAKQIQSQIKKVMVNKDLFMNIRSASTDELVLALEGEHPQTVAVVLSELSPQKSQEVLSLLGEEVRLKAVCKMTNPDVLGAEVRQRMATMVNERLRDLKGETLVIRPGRREQNLRKLAIMLSGLERDLRDQLVGEIGKHDEETGKTVRNLMVTWEDIRSVADRSLQEALRTVDSGKLAVALYGADDEIAQKIRSNISERAAAMLDEEASLMQEPLEKEVLDAREEVVVPLREANEQGKLRMVGR
ncbi:MAG TPA: FliG C-terminal domain-containing protein [Sedimentisphaerales bacterium]|nr:FliG C-terminal domain-containing protein [Sedimentisphaerales bacterium]